MDILFKNSKLEKEFGDERALKRKRGDRQSRLIMRRVAELIAVENLEALRAIPGPRCHEWKGDLKGHLSVDLDHPYRLIFMPANDPIPTLPDGGLDWNKVTSIRILGVQDTHE